MNILKVLDPRLMLKDEHTLIATTGAAQINSVHYPVNSVSNSNIVIQANPSSERNYFDPNILIHCKFRITCTGSNSSFQPLMMPSLVGPAFKPLRRVITSEAVAINGTSCQLQNPHIYSPMLMAHYEGDLNGTLDREGSMTPSYPDNSDHFLLPPYSYTSVRNPLSSSYDNTAQSVPRGAFAGYVPISNEAGGTTSTYTLEVCEPILVSPFKSGSGSFNDPAFTYVSSLLYTANIANLSRVLSVAYPPDSITGLPTYSPDDLSGGQIVIQNINVSLESAELIMFNYTVNADVPRPMSLVRSYNEIIDYSTSNFQVLAPGQTTTISLANQSFGSIPQMCYLWIPVQSSTFTNSGLPSACTVPDACLQIGGGFNQNSNFCPISINFDNKLQSQSFSSWDLYKIAVKNGCTSSMSEFIGMPFQGAGSSSKGMMLKMFFGSDILLNEGTYVGQTGRFQFTVQATVYNQTQQPCYNPELHCTVVYDGFSRTTENLSTTNNQASFTEQELQGAPLVSDVKIQSGKKVFGGGFWDTLKSVLGPINSALRDSKIISKHITPRFAPSLTSAAESLGYGYHRRAASKRGGVVFE